MRLLDCKSPVCQQIGEGAPMMLDFLCEECTDHFAQVKARLDAMGILYIINPRIVRGLDYYTKTVFEFVTDKIGAQSTICAGGRYDGLIEQLGAGIAGYWVCDGVGTDSHDHGSLWQPFSSPAGMRGIHWQYGRCSGR